MFKKILVEPYDEYVADEENYEKKRGHIVFRFPNNYGLSVITGYGRLRNTPETPYEGAIIKWEKKEDENDDYEVLSDHPLLSEGHTEPSNGERILELMKKVMGWADGENRTNSA